MAKQFDGASPKVLTRQMRKANWSKGVHLSHISYRNTAVYRVTMLATASWCKRCQVQLCILPPVFTPVRAVSSAVTQLIATIHRNPIVTPQRIEPGLHHTVRAGRDLTTWRSDDHACHRIEGFMFCSSTLQPFSLCFQFPVCCKAKRIASLRLHLIATAHWVMVGRDKPLDENKKPHLSKVRASNVPCRPPSPTRLPPGRLQVLESLADMMATVSR